MLAAVLILASLIFSISIVTISALLNKEGQSAHPSTSPVLESLKPFLKSEDKILFLLLFFWASAIVLVPLVTLEPDENYFFVLNRFLGLSALILLILTLLPGLIKVFFSKFILNSIFLTARRTFGLGTLFFALVHSLLSFYLYFDFSINNFFFLSFPYQMAAIFGFIALLILILMGLSDIPLFKHFLGPHSWKKLHRLVYLGGILIVLHTFVRGKDFQENTLVSLTILGAILTITSLEVFATALEWNKHSNSHSRFGTVMIHLLITLVFAVALYLSFVRLLQN